MCAVVVLAAMLSLGASSSLLGAAAGFWADADVALCADCEREAENRSCAPAPCAAAIAPSLAAPAVIRDRGRAWPLQPQRTAAGRDGRPEPPPPKA